MTRADKHPAAALFEAALEQAPSDRGAYLDEACRDDPVLRAEVESLLEADDRAGGFLEPSERTLRGLSQVPDPLVGAHLGSYHIQRVIAAGGMGTVYEALQEEPRRTVALKVIRSGIASRSALQRFKHESEILGRLRHPGIAQIYEAGTHGGPNGVPFFAMEFIPGARTITRYAEEDSLSPRARLELFAKVCDAVLAGHRRGVIHRDLKPANILIDERGQPKLIDFGVARATDADLTVVTMQTEAGQLVGTLRYMSPEQCEGDAIGLDTRSDVYALGVVLFELLTGKLPYDFNTPSPFDVPRVIREQEPQHLSAINRMWRGDIETIVLKALEKNRDHRYQSVTELMRDIQHYLDHEPIEAKRGRRWYVLLKLLRRHRIAAVVTAAFVMVVLASALGLGLLYKDSEHQRQALEERSEQLNRAVYLNNITLAHRDWEAGDSIAIAQHLASCPTDMRGWEWHFLHRLADSSLTTFRGHTDAVGALAVSPGGESIASGSYDGTLRLWDITTGRALRTLKSDGFVEQISFSPDGRFVACAGRESSNVHVWDTTTGEPVETCLMPSNNAVAYSPDGTRIAAGGYYHEPLRIWNARTGELLREWPDIKRIRGIDICWSPDSKWIASARPDGTVILLDTETGQIVRSFEGHTLDLKCAAFSPDGQFLATTSYDTTLRIWNVESGEQLHIFHEPGQHFTRVSFSPDSKRVASACGSALRVWELASGKQEAARLGHADSVGALVFTPDGQRIVTASHDRLVKIWDATAQTHPPILATSTCGLSSVVVSPDGETIAAGDEAGLLWILGPSQDREVKPVHAHHGRLYALAFDPAGSRLASGGDDGRIHIWQYPFAQPRVTMEAPKTTVVCVAWAPGIERLASGHSDGTVRVWDLLTGNVVWSANAHRGWVLSVAFNANGTRILTAGNNTGVRIWDANSGTHLQDLETGAHRNVAAISPSGRLVAAGTDQNEVWIWNLETGERLWKAEGHVGQIQALAFLPNERRLVSADYHSMIELWNVATGKATLTLRQHDSGVKAVAVSPDGRWFVSASADKTVKLWDADDRVPPEARPDASKAEGTAAPRTQMR